MDSYSSSIPPPFERPLYTVEAGNLKAVYFPGFLEARVLDVNMVPLNRSTFSRFRKQTWARGDLPPFWVVCCWQTWWWGHEGVLQQHYKVCSPSLWVLSVRCSASQFWSLDFWSLLLNVINLFLDSSSRDGLKGSRSPGGSVLGSHANICLFLNYYIYYY